MPADAELREMVHNLQNDIEALVRHVDSIAGVDLSEPEIEEVLGRMRDAGVWTSKHDITLDGMVRGGKTRAQGFAVFATGNALAHRLIAEVRALAPEALTACATARIVVVPIAEPTAASVVAEQAAPTTPKRKRGRPFKARTDPAALVSPDEQAALVPAAPQRPLSTL